MGVFDRMKSLFLGAPAQKKGIMFKKVTNKPSFGLETQELKNTDKPVSKDKKQKHFVEPESYDGTSSKISKEEKNNLKKRRNKIYTKLETPTKLTYTPNEIVSMSSPFAHQQRRLQSAERFFEGKDYNMAAKIYKRLLNRIPSKMIRDKLKINLSDIERMMEEQSNKDKASDPEGGKQQWDINPYLSSQIMQYIAQSSIEVREAIFRSQQMEANIKEAPSKSKAQNESNRASLGFPVEQSGIHQAENTQKKPDSQTTERTPVGTPISQTAGAKENISNTEIMDTPSNASTHEMAEKEVSTKEVTQLSSEKDSSQESIKTGEEQSQKDANNPYGQKVRNSPIEAISKPDKESKTKESTKSIVGEDENNNLDSSKQTQPIVHGVFEIKPPEPEDSASLTLTYDFTKMPYHFHLAQDNQIVEYNYYKYKPMLEKAHKFVNTKQIAKALNYYKTINDQEIPHELKNMIKKNMEDINDFIKKYFS